MALFQHSVITKHLNAIDKKQLESKWIEYSAHFLNSSIQAQIRNLKEEQYQGEFLEDLFVKILGYTKAPQPNHNLITEQKNQTNSKKADGAILITDSKGFQTVRAVIELKGTDTTDLSKIETQAFGYKNNQPECVYVITSNFEKIRFYIENAVDFIEFNLFTLSRKDFDLLYCCLAYENIKANSPKHLKDESVSKESQITKQLYKDYSDFKRALYNNLVEKNPQIDKLLLFKKTQKLLDRFLFVFFAEDRQLVPTNLIRRINLEWENLKKARIPVSLYDRYKVYFEDLNTGAKVTLPAFGKKTGDAISAEFEIFAYNGGLFLPDEILDNVQIDDEILHKHSIILSGYDFDSDVDVNILGHIFENSLNEIDEIKSEIEGNVIDKTKTKRKKDGVFYTPKYITKYIVENTVGKLCEEKKAEFAIIDEEFAKGRKNRNKTTIQKLDSDLQSYRDWLLQITICDPACGSGAFLNQALEFLIQEHKYIDELQAQLFGSSIGFPGAELHILENNIYGVDLNDESVEIAKLSLWLRTAQKGRKLNSLNNNIKAGNSLIDDPAVAGDKAFSWEKEFPEVFKEKNKFSYHITTSLHDSRTSDRMIQFKARERRFEGTKPNPEVFPMTKEEEELIARTVADIVKEDNLDIAAFNLCWDHMHILLVCEEDEVPKIVQKIKAKTAREVNIFRGKTIVSPREHAPLTETEKHAPLADMDTEKHAPLADMDTEKHAPSTDMDTEKHAPSTDMDTEKRAPSTDMDTEKHSLSTDAITNAPLPKRGEKQNSLWTQKYHCNPITSEEQFWNTYNYIENNKVKHKLPNNPKLKSIISTFLKSFEACFKTKYSGGFDVIIGNPPYVTSKGSLLNDLDKIYFKEKFETASYQIDLYILFIEKCFHLINNFGFSSLIIPNSWMNNSYLEPTRKFLIVKTEINNLAEMEKNTFADANVDTVIITFSKVIRQKKTFLNIFEKNQFYNVGEINQNDWLKEEKSIVSIRKDSGISKIIKNIRTNSIQLSELSDIGRGVGVYHKRVGHTKELIALDPYQSNCKEDDTFVPYLRGRNVNFYSTTWNNNSFISYGKWLAEPRDIKFFEGERIILRQIPSKKLMVTLIKEKFITDQSVFIAKFTSKNNYSTKYILGVLGSNLMSFYFRFNFSEFDELFPKVKLEHFKSFPIKNVNFETQELFSIKVEYLLGSNKFLEELSQKFSTYFSNQYKIEKLSGKLEKWHELAFTDFIKELNKAIKAVGGVQLTKKDEFEWIELFEENKQKALELKAEIDKTDKEIDQMVYALYGLTEEEIKIVEGVV